MREFVLRSELQPLSVHEHVAMLEQSYSVDERGNVNVQPRFLPLVTAVRLVVSLVQRVRPDYKVDFSNPGWAALKGARGTEHHAAQTQRAMAALLQAVTKPRVQTPPPPRAPAPPPQGVRQFKGVRQFI
jgi:hypothetical protein